MNKKPDVSNIWAKMEDLLQQTKRTFHYFNE